MRLKSFLQHALVLAAAAPLAAQQNPPVRMGLWQSNTVTSMTGLQVPPEIAARLKAMGRPVPGAEPRTFISQSCLTPDKWKEMFSINQDRQNCTLSNFHQDSHGMSGDITCTSSTGTAHGHMQMSFLSQEKVHGTIHTEVVTQQQAQPIVMDMTVDSVYQGADCKGISPDKPQVVMK